MNIFKKLDKRKRLIVISAIIAGVTIIVALLGGFLGYNAYEQEMLNRGTPIKLNIGDYYATSDSFRHTVDNSIPFTMEGQENNPDRGYRMETYITLGSLKAYPGNEGENAFDELEKEKATFAEENVHMAQVYVYLIEYYNKPLDDKAFQQLTQYFEALRDSNIRALLRFAYEYDSSIGKGPTTSRIVSHCKQLKGWFNDNKALVADTLYAVQFGMVGLWGEGHGYVHKPDLGRISEALVDMIPEPYIIQVRYPHMWQKISKKIINRFSLHDDFLVGIEHEWGLTLRRESEFFPKVIDMCKSRLTDGEMPWGRDDTCKEIDYKLLLKQTVDYALTTLSLKHNYKETEGEDYHLKKWQDVNINSGFLEASGFPYAPFALDSNKEITVYDYLDKHLGYVLAASNLKKTADGYQFILSNYGFNAPHDYEMYLMTDEGEIPYKHDLSTVSQYGQKVINVKTNGKTLKVAFKHKSGTKLTIKLANTVNYENGWNDLTPYLPN